MEKLRAEVVGHALATAEIYLSDGAAERRSAERRNLLSDYNDLAPPSALRLLGVLLALLAVGIIFFILGLQVTMGTAHAAQPPKALPPSMQQSDNKNVVYPARTKLDFEGAKIEGELRNPGEFYFLSRDSEKFDSLVKRRKNFHREMLRDVVLTK